MAYYFGKMLQDSLQVPVGLICNAIGGSPTEAWIDRSSLEYHFPAILRNWTKNDFIQDWVRGRAALNVKKSTDKLQRHPMNLVICMNRVFFLCNNSPLKALFGIRENRMRIIVRRTKSCLNY